MSNNQNNQINLNNISEAVDSILTQTEEIKTKLTDNEYKKLLETLQVIHEKNNKKVNWCKYKVKFAIVFPKITMENGFNLIGIDYEEITQCYNQKEIKDGDFERLSNDKIYLYKKGNRIIQGGGGLFTETSKELKESIRKSMRNISIGYPPNVKLGKTKMKINLELKIKVKYIKKLKIYDENYEYPRMINYDSDVMAEHSSSSSDSDSSRGSRD